MRGRNSTSPDSQPTPEVTGLSPIEPGDHNRAREFSFQPMTITVFERSKLYFPVSSQYYATDHHLLIYGRNQNFDSARSFIAT